MVYLEAHATDNADIVCGKQVIDGIHRTGKRVLDWQHTELTKATADSPEHTLEIAHIHNLGEVEKTLRCKMGI